VKISNPTPLFPGIDRLTRRDCIYVGHMDYLAFNKRGMGLVYDGGMGYGSRCGDDMSRDGLAGALIKKKIKVSSYIRKF
jgi:hypothetical protein